MRTLCKPTVYFPTIGLEVHAQLQTSHKLFSKSHTSSHTKSNETCALHATDLALPGTLPVLNPDCVHLAARAALLLGCKLNTRSSFERKHYFYPDMPQGYQITQNSRPLASNGFLKFGDGQSSSIKQIQLEQDSGKLVDLPLSSALGVDYNRVGMPLIEIVFEVSDRSERALMKTSMRAKRAVSEASSKRRASHN